MAAWFSGRMPVPVSTTSMTRFTWVSQGFTPRARTSTWPLAVNLSAFDTRFMRIWRMRSSSPLRPAVQVGIDVEQQLDAFLVRALREEVDHFLDDLPDIEVLRFEAQLAGLDLREVENVVDDGEQRVGGALNRRREAALARIELRIQQQLGHAHHAVHRRADFVRHARQELALGLAAPPRRRGRLRRCRSWPVAACGWPPPGSGAFFDLAFEQVVLRAPAAARDSRSGRTCR